MESLPGHRGARAHPCPSVRGGFREQSCTALLDDPAGVLADRRRWPDHICYEDFCRASTELWALQQAHIRDACLRWHSYYPLPVGARALEDLEEPGSGEAALLAPFGGEEKALWALRVEQSRTVLDMFGLADSRRTGGEYLYVGGFVFVLRGHDPALAEVAHSARDWWKRFRGMSVGPGRPRGGMWRSGEECEAALRQAARRLQDAGKRVTQDSMAEVLGFHRRTLQSWLDRYEIDWRKIRGG